jgi:hypothetical protein
VSPSSDHSAIGELASTLRPRFGPVAGDPPSPALSDDEVLDEFLRSMLLWESTTALADAAWGRLIAAVVDANELRVCAPAEIAGVLGPAYPLVHERCERLHAALGDAFRTQHKLAQPYLCEQGKREARACLEAIDGVPGYVAARVALLRLGGHAAPVDGRILKRLVEAGAVPRGRSCTEAASLVERHVRAGELVELSLLLQSWADELPLPEPLPVPPGLGKVGPRDGSAPVRARPPRPGRGRSPSEKS